MASPELAIAKAALSASLFRADPAPISRPSVDTFLQQISATLTECSRPNVQTCKDYIISNISHSAGRSTALAKYLVALSKFQVDNPSQHRLSTKRRRLHVLYVVNDVLHHVVARQGDRDFTHNWEAHLPILIGSAASFDNCPKHVKKLQDLINLWQEKQYVSEAVLAKLQESLAKGSSSTSPPDTSSSNTTTLKLAKDAPYLIPSNHGDASTAWYDLPAATWLPHLVPNSTKPMLPDLIRPIQLAPGPANQALIGAVKALLSDAERLFSRERALDDDDPHFDLNEFGERVVLDEVTGDIVSGETYYGWSRQFCQRMKERRKKVTGRGRRSESRSRSRRSASQDSFSRRRRRWSTSSSRSFKRRRTSRSRSRERSRSRSRGRSRSRSRSRNRSRSYMPSRSPSSRRGHRSHSPGLDHQSSSHNTSAPNNSHLSHAPHLPPPPPPHHNAPFNMPVPPPPPGYHGPWPPPPPPPFGPASQGWIPDPAFAAQMMSSWGTGQVPPVPQPPYNNDSHNSRGYSNGGGYRGRGRGYHRGSGGYTGRGR